MTRCSNSRTELTKLKRLLESSNTALHSAQTAHEAMSAQQEHARAAHRENASTLEAAQVKNISKRNPPSPPPSQQPRVLCVWIP